MFSWFYVEEGTDDFLAFFLFSLKSSEFGNNKAYDTFSPDSKTALKGLPFCSSVRMWRSPAWLLSSEMGVAAESRHLPGSDYKKMPPK